MFHIIYISPQIVKRRNQLNGNGGNPGGPIGHKPAGHHKTNSLLYGQGCKHWHDCFTCPLPDCTYDYMHEWNRKREELT